MSRAGFQPRREPKTSDLLIRQKVEAMIEYGHCALRQFPKSERHVLSAEIRGSMWALLRLVIVCNKRYHKKTTLQDLDAELDLLRPSVQRFPFLSTHRRTSGSNHWAAFPCGIIPVSRLE